MHCKNCNAELSQNDNFCRDCGAKIVKERITVKHLIASFLAAFGWESNFFITLRYLLVKPQIVFKEYINGTRKKYTNPFTFFTISLAISLFVFSQYSEQYIHLTTDLNLQETEQSESKVSMPDKDKGFKLLGYKNQDEFQKSIAKFQLKYYNLVSFLYLPLFTLIAFFVFRKPYNFGEQLVINTYLLSITTFFGVLTFIFSLLAGINILLYTTFFTFLYYSYAYKKLYELSFGKLLVKIMKFIGITLVLYLIILIVGAIIVAVVAIIKSKL